MKNPVEAAARFLRRASAGRFPPVALILGSGLGEAADRLMDAGGKSIPYRNIPGFSAASVPGHEGRLMVGTAAGRPLAVLLGRRHFYEGIPMEEVIRPTRVLSRLGVRTLLLTSAVGALSRRLPVGGLCAVSDHINFMGANPLRGPHAPGEGPRFPDMTEVYSSRLRRLARAEARRQGFTLPEGVYLAVSGPTYETPAETRLFRSWGADLAGMSLVPEATAARRAGMETLAIAVVANRAAGLASRPLSHEEVLSAGSGAAPRLAALLGALLPAC